MKYTNIKISVVVLSLLFIGISLILGSCISVSPDTVAKIKSEAQDVQNKLKQELETGLQQTDTQLSPPITTMQGIRAGYSTAPRISYSLFVILKPTNIVIPDKYYTVDLYEKDVFRQSSLVSWNQPELNVLKEKDVEFISNRQEFDAYIDEDISHIFSVKVHE